MYCKKFDIEISKDDVVCEKCYLRNMNGYCKYISEEP